MRCAPTSILVDSGAWSRTEGVVETYEGAEVGHILLAQLCGEDASPVQERSNLTSVPTVAVAQSLPSTTAGSE